MLNSCLSVLEYVYIILFFKKNTLSVKLCSQQANCYKYTRLHQSLKENGGDGKSYMRLI